MPRSQPCSHRYRRIPPSRQPAQPRNDETAVERNGESEWVGGGGVGEEGVGGLIDIGPNLRDAIEITAIFIFLAIALRVFLR